MIDIDVFISKCEKDIDCCLEALKQYSNDVESLERPSYGMTIHDWDNYYDKLYMLSTCVRDNIGEIKHLQECINSAEVMRTQMAQWQTVEYQSKKFDARIK